MDFNTHSTLPLLISALSGYLIGSIPFGVIATKMAGINIRDVGSGNIGATNVLRTGRKDLALMTLVGDVGKGALAVGLAALVWGTLFRPDTDILQTTMALAGGFAFLGHCFPVWLKFKGGKGVATFLGTLTAACWPMGLGAALIWLITAVIFRISSLSALMAASLVLPLGFILHQPYPFKLMALGMAIILTIRHRDNISRLIKGTEPRIGASKSSDNTPKPQNDAG